MAVAALALLSRFGFSLSAAAAEVTLSGTGTFQPPAADRLALIPVVPGFSRNDLASGTWSFEVRYEDRVPDSDPDPWVGRYAGAIRSFRLTVGETTVDFPAENAELIVSDGGLNFPFRESIRLEASTVIPSGTLRIGWIQLNQPPNWHDLRGKPGALTSDALPEPSMLANLPTASPFDRFLLLQVYAPSDSTKPLLYISSSKVSVLTRSTAAR